MDVSIVTATYNGERYLGETVESVLRQTRDDWELVIVDDGSRDGTVGVAQGYARRDSRIRVVRQANGGVGAARNRGFSETDPGTRYVAFLDQDDLYEPDALASLVAALEENPEHVAATGLARYIDERSRPIRCGEAETWGRRRVRVSGNRFVESSATEPTSFAVLALACRILTPGQGLIRRVALARTGAPPADPTTAASDWDMWLRLAAYGDIAFVDRVVLGYRQHGESMSSNQKSLAEAMRYVRRKLIRSPQLSEEQREIAIRSCRLYHRYEASLRMTWARKHLRRGELDAVTEHLLLGARSYARYLRGVTV